MSRLLSHIIVFILGALVVGTSVASVTRSHSVRPRTAIHHTALASAYGPGLYGNGTGCGQRLYQGSTWVANKTLPCGSRVQICLGRRCHTLRVEDRGPYVGGRTFDMTSGATELWGMSVYQWGVRSVTWRRA